MLLEIFKKCQNLEKQRRKVVTENRDKFFGVGLRSYYKIEIEIERERARDR